VENIFSLAAPHAREPEKYAHPLTASALWLAAAVLLVYRMLGPQTEGGRLDLIDSKIELLKEMMREYCSF
jgi:hypothetical protein